MEATKKSKAIEEAKAEYVKVWKGDEKMIKFCQGEINNAVRLSDGRIVIVKKQKLKTDFCFGYSDCGQGMDYDEALRAEQVARKNEDYFRRKNLEDLQEKIDLLKTKKEESWHMDAYLRQSNYCSYGPINIHEVVGLHRHAFEEQKWGTYVEIPEADRQLIIAMYEEEKAKMSKRIDTYLKRHGLSKLRTWTYWRDE